MKEELLKLMEGEQQGNLFPATLNTTPDIPAGVGSPSASSSTSTVEATSTATPDVIAKLVAALNPLIIAAQQLTSSFNALTQKEVNTTNNTSTTTNVTNTDTTTTRIEGKPTATANRVEGHTTTTTGNIDNRTVAPTDNRVSQKSEGVTTNNLSTVNPTATKISDTTTTNNTNNLVSLMGQLKSVPTPAGNQSTTNVMQNVLSVLKDIFTPNTTNISGNKVANNKTNVMESATTNITNNGGDVMSNISSLTSLASSVSTVFTSVVSTGRAIAETFSSLVTMSKGYVEAYSPTTVNVFNEAMRDLTATVGLALTPVITTATSFVRNFSSVLLPISRQLQPVISKMSESFSQVAEYGYKFVSQTAEALTPLFDLMGTLTEVAVTLSEPFLALGNLVGALVAPMLNGLAKGFKILLDVLSPVVAIFGMLADAITVVQTLFTAFTDVLTSVLQLDTSGLKNIANSLRDGFRELLRAVILAVAGLAKLAGFTGFVDSLRKGLEGGRREDATGLAAMKDSKITSFAEFGKEVAKAASIATGEDGQKATTDDWLKRISEDLANLKDRNIWKDVEEAMYNALVRAIPGAKTFEGVAKPVANAASTAWDYYTWAAKKTISLGTW